MAATKSHVQPVWSMQWETHPRRLPARRSLLMGSRRPPGRGTVNAEPGRLAAYTDLIGAVLDLRAPEPTQTFDAALADAVGAGRLAPELARELRWLQRQTERAIVEHAATVLPPALVALQTTETHHPAQQPHSGSLVAPEPAEPYLDYLDDLDESDETDELDELEAAPVVQLQSRRLLVAGLRPLPDPVHRGTLP